MLFKMMLCLYFCFHVLCLCTLAVSNTYYSLRNSYTRLGHTKMNIVSPKARCSVCAYDRVEK